MRLQNLEAQLSQQKGNEDTSQTNALLLSKILELETQLLKKDQQTTLELIKKDLEQLK